MKIYQDEKFMILLLETGELKIMSLENHTNISIIPQTENSVIIKTWKR